jgi:hypothetical protein
VNDETFWNRVDATGDCWIWMGSRSNGRGAIYGNLNLNGIHEKAHRASWKILVGEIPIGKILDHLCRNTLCVNPDHLEPVTHKENCQRGVAGAITANRQKSKTHCLRGHAFDEHNTLKKKNGSRDCRECKNGLRRGIYEGWR